MNWYKKTDISDYDKNRLEGQGQQIIETIRLGDYDLTLVNSYGGIKQIGLAYKGMSFTGTPQQQDERRMLGVPDLDLDGMKNKINEWLSSYGKLYVGVSDEKKLDTYKSILQHLKFNFEIETIFDRQILVIER